VREKPSINNNIDEHERSFVAKALFEIILLRKATHQTIEKSEALEQHTNEKY
jgi:hypothetical protein